MTRMFPPDEPRGGRNVRSESAAEEAIYEALRSWLRGDAVAGDEYIIFQGLKWFSNRPNGAREPFREMDFLIVSRRFGLLIVEAKAAKIALQGKGGARAAT